MAEKKRLITVKDAAKLEGVSERAIRMRIADNSIMAKSDKSSSGGGLSGQQWLIDPASLSIPAKAKWAKRMYQAEEKKMAELEQREKAEQLPLFPTSKRQGAFLPDGALNPAAVEEMCGKDVYEKAMQEARDKFAIVEKAVAIIASRQNVTEGIKGLAAAHGINPATLYRWIKDAEKGVAGLLRRRAVVVNGRRHLSITEGMEPSSAPPTSNRARPKSPPSSERSPPFAARAASPSLPAAASAAS
jgi:transposase-like protein